MLSRRGRKKNRRTRRRRQRGGAGGTAIIIEPRKKMVPALSFVINNVLDNLGTEWKLIVFPGKENKDEVATLIKALPKEKKSRASIHDLGLDTMTTKSYNDLMMSDRILNQIPTEMFLVIQTDSLICKQGKDLLEKFMKYDYVGAPWKGRNAIGNGGFSLRRKSKMLEILAKCDKANHNEDGFFSGGCEGALPSKPSPEEAEEFSIETVKSKGVSFGIHKAWYHLPEQVDEHNSQCLGYSTLKNLNTGQGLKIGLMAIFKNESMVLREWIEHYKWQGVDTIVLLNNDSTDDWKSITDDYKDFVTVFDVPGKHQQLPAYNKTGIPFLKEKGVDVMIVADIDEYYFGKDGRLLKEFINETFTKPDRPSGYTCGWSMFGSNGHIKHPKSVREAFTKRWQKDAEPENGISGKTTMLLSDLKDNNLSCQHLPELKGERISCPEGLQMNHYAVMSKEYFDKVKAVRGDVFTANHDSVRDDAYFNKYDKNVVTDTLLADQVKNLKAS